MTGYLPKPYKNESFYSIVARCRRHLLLPNAKVRDILFNGKRVYPLTGLANFVKDFVDCTSAVFLTTSNDLLRSHTVANYLKHFYPRDRWKAVEKKMIAGDNTLLSFMGINGGSTDQKLPRYCPKCNEESMRSNGELNWNLLHQIPGIGICVVHKCFLHPAEFEYVNRGSHQFIPATNQNCPIFISTDCCDVKMVSVAMKMVALLSTDLSANYCLRNYREEAMKLGFVVGMRFDYRRFSKELNSFYAKETEWLKNLSASPLFPRGFIYSSTQAFRPLSHLLIEYFFENRLVSKNTHPFGKGPWKCPNRLCNQSRSKSINDCTWHFNEDARYVGTFTCKCGMVHIKSYSQKTPINIMRRIVDYGYLWRGKVKKLLAAKLPASKISLIVGCHNWKRHYYRRETNGNQNKVNSRIGPRFQRADWKEIVRCNPNTTITQLRKTNGIIYSFLLKYDHDWFVSFNRKFSGRKRVISAKQYHARDEQICRKLESSLKKLLSAQYPYRISKNLLLNSINQRTKNLERLPKTSSVLGKISESKINFKRRMDRP